MLCHSQCRLVTTSLVVEHWSRRAKPDGWTVDALPSLADQDDTAFLSIKPMSGNHQINDAS